jgi:hypothetical protein
MSANKSLVDDQEECMNTTLQKGWSGGALMGGLLALSCMSLSTFGAPSAGEKAVPVTIPRAVCGAGDHPESALQGQVPAALRATGFNGFNCNLQLIGQSKGDGANWQTTEYKDKAGHTCGYHGTAFTTAGRTHLGVPVIDLTDPTKPTPTTYLQTTSMLDPWESLKVNERRQLLAADNGHNGGGGPEIDIYDVSTDCRFPQLLSTVAVGTAGGGGAVATVVGHEGSWAPDGLTYYGGDLRTNGGQYYAVDTADPTKPKLITTWVPGIANVHGMSISEDGNRGYFVSLGFGDNLSDPNSPATNGLLVYDLTQIQARVTNPQVPLISKLLWKDGSGAQHTIPVKIGGKPYVIFVDEAGSGGFASLAQAQTACAAGFTPFPLARIIDMSDEKNPAIVSRLALEIHAVKSCPLVLPDVVGLSTFTYGSHYCSVDNKQNATTLACGYFSSGIRVFDIRNPLQPKEIAYYNPAGVTTPTSGSNHVRAGGWVAGGPDWCSAQIHLDAAKGTLWTTCQDNGLLMFKFTNGAWPFPESSTPPGQQN